MSDDLSGFSLMDLFRSEADGQTALLSEGLMALEGVEDPSPSSLESLMRAAHSLKGAARIVGAGWASPATPPGITKMRLRARTDRTLT